MTDAARLTDDQLAWCERWAASVIELATTRRLPSLRAMTLVQSALTELAELRTENADLRRAVPLVDAEGQTTWPSIHDNPTVLREHLFERDGQLDAAEAEVARLRAAVRGFAYCHPKGAWGCEIICRHVDQADGGNREAWAGERHAEPPEKPL